MNELNFLLQSFYCLPTKNFVHSLEIRIQREGFYDLCNEMIVRLILTLEKQIGNLMQPQDSC
jgi:hypothetical protein